MNLLPRANYFRIWQATFAALLRDRVPLFRVTLLLAGPFFILDGLVSANHMMTLGGAMMTGSDIPLEQMRLLWGSTVLADSLAFSMLCGAAVILFRCMAAQRPASTRVLLRREIPALLGSWRFWLFALFQFMVFAFINTPDGRFKLPGMALAALGAFLLWRTHDVRDGKAAPLNWKAWMCVLWAVLTFPVLFILFNGYAHALLLMAIDQAGQQLLFLFEPASPLLPFGIITLARFISQWFNLVPVLFLLFSYLAIGSPAAPLTAAAS
jgi:hypothetical protein